MWTRKTPNTDTFQAVSAIIAFQNRDMEKKGCFYHLPSNIRKYIQRLCLLHRYIHEEEFMRMLLALAFFRPWDIIHGFEELANKIRVLYNDVADDLLQYFDGTYIRMYYRTALRQPPLFAIDLWNMFHQIDDKLPHTKNSNMEGWHRFLEAHVSTCHPVFWIFLSVLQKEENMIPIFIVKDNVGHPPQPP